MEQSHQALNPATRRPSHAHLAPLTDEWIASLHRASLMERGQVLAPSTARAMRNRIAQVAKRASGEALPLVLADRAKVEAVLSGLHDGLSPASARNAIKAFVSYAEFLAARGDAVALTAADIPRRAKARRAITTYDDEETQLLVLAAELVNPRLHLAMMSLVDTGLRVGELLGLRWADLKLDHAPPHYRLTTTKTDARLVVLSPRLLALWETIDTEQLKSGKGEKDRAGRKQRRTWLRDPEVHPFPYSYAGFHTLFVRIAD
ncbi:MAG: site-specific integrase, partial [Acidimicrobiia bacterium]